jgi:hypothetical protein
MNLTTRDFFDAVSPLDHGAGQSATKAVGAVETVPIEKPLSIS